MQEWNSINIDSRPSTIIDVGCARATTALYKSFSGTPVLMIDPLHEYAGEMRRVAEETGGAYECVALGSEEGQLDIHVNLDRLVRSSMYRRSELTRTDHKYELRRVPMSTMDATMKKYGKLNTPYGLKIDVEGYELEVLKGSVGTLRACCFVIVEASIQRRFEGSYSFECLIAFMSEHNFCISNVLSAEPDNAGLVRYVDLLFVPRSSNDHRPC